MPFMVGGATVFKGGLLKKTETKQNVCEMYPPLNDAMMFYFTDTQFKDNPAFSMLNDSDDEVIYG